MLDASALLAWLQSEPGADQVELEGAVMNRVLNASTAVAAERAWSKVRHGVSI